MKEMIKAGWIYFLITIILVAFIFLTFLYDINAWVKFVVSGVAFYAMLYKVIIDIKK